MARLTEDARSLGHRGEAVLFRIDFVRDSSLGYDKPRIELLIYHCDRYEHVLQTYGVHMSNLEAVELLARLDDAIQAFDNYTSSN